MQKPGSTRPPTMSLRRQRLMKDFLVKKVPGTAVKKRHEDAERESGGKLPPPCKINFGDDTFAVPSPCKPRALLREENKENAASNLPSNFVPFAPSANAEKERGGDRERLPPLPTSSKIFRAQPSGDSLQGVDSRDSLLSQCSQFSQYSQDDYLTPVDQPVLPSNNPATPSPIRKKSRHASFANRLYLPGEEREREEDRALNALVEDMDILDVSRGYTQEEAGNRGEGVAEMDCGDGGSRGSPAGHLPEINVNPFIADPHREKRKRRGRSSISGNGLRVSPNVCRYLYDFSEVEMVGSGCFSQVFKVRHRIDGAIYALKKFRRGFKGAADRERGLVEVFALSAIAHCDHVIRYYNAWIEDDVLYIQTEFCSGGTLEDEYKRRKEKQASAAPSPRPCLFPEHVLKTVIYHIAKALQELHTLRLAHLDIKPSNILITEDGRYKLGDFGQVARFDEENDACEGDNRYLSRELLEGYRGNLQAADMFALGATIYELALAQGSLPGQGEDWQRIRNGHLVPFRHYSPQFQGLLASLMHPDPHQRPSARMLLTSEVLLSARPTDSLEANGDESAQMATLREQLAEKSRSVEALEAVLAAERAERRKLELSLQKLKNARQSNGAEENGEKDVMQAAAY